MRTFLYMWVIALRIVTMHLYVCPMSAAGTRERKALESSQINFEASRSEVKAIRLHNAQRNMP